jgi:hypothetical protein
VRTETAKHFNDLARELQADPLALEKRLHADMQRMFGGPAFFPLVPRPLAPEEPDTGTAPEDFSEASA